MLGMHVWVIQNEDAEECLVRRGQAVHCIGMCITHLNIV